MALPTVVRTSGSAPCYGGRPIVVRDDGAFARSVSASCLEATVIEAARAGCPTVSAAQALGLSRLFALRDSWPGFQQRHDRQDSGLPASGLMQKHVRREPTRVSALAYKQTKNGCFNDVARQRRTADSTTEVAAACATVPGS